MTSIQFGLKYYKRHIPVAIFTQIISFIATIADLFLPLFMEMFIDYVICSNIPETDSLISIILSKGNIQVHSMQLFWRLALIYGGLLLFRIVLVYIVQIINQNLGLSLETDLRMATYRKLMQLDTETISEYNTGELLQTINSDTIMYKQLFCFMIPTIIDGIIALCISIVVLAKINLWLLLIPGSLTPLFVIQLYRFKKMARDKYMNIRSNSSTMNLTVQENIEAVRLVRSFTNEDLEQTKFEKINETLKKSHLELINLSAKFEALFSSIKQFAYIGTIAVSAILVIFGKFQVGYLVACSSYVMKIINYINRLNNLIFRMQQQNVSGQKMMNFMMKEPKVPDVLNENKVISNQIYNKKPNLKINNLTLTLGGKDVLKNIELDIPYGKKIGITGSTGCGKSILLESLVRNYEFTKGSITLDGKSIESISLQDLRTEYSYVFQEAFLFSNTILSNIAYAEKDSITSDQEQITELEKELIIEASKHAQAYNFINSLPDKYSTIVGERGIGLSGGQKQRLSIARALMKNAPVLIFDDSTSALDVETERRLLSNIKKYYNDKTVMISAHRLSSVKDCDEIIYMQDGSIIERGSFDELIKLNGHFATVYKIQEEQQQAIMDYDALAVKGEK